MLRRLILRHLSGVGAWHLAFGSSSAELERAKRLPIIAHENIGKLPCKDPQIKLK